MTINTIVCFFVLVQAETAPDVKVLAVRNIRTQKHIQTFLTRRVRTFTPHREHITIIIYLTQLNAGPEFRFGNFSLSQVFTLRKKLQCLQGYSPAVFELYRGLWGAQLFLFFYNGGILCFCACDGLTKIHKSYGGGVQYIYIYIYM